VKSVKSTKPRGRSWRVSIIRKRGQYLGTVEAPNEKAAEAAAVAEFDPATSSAGGSSCGSETNLPHERKESPGRAAPWIARRSTQLVPWRTRPDCELPK
jgi:hypothetical protein